MANKHPLEIFMPPNILKAKVGSGGLDASALLRAELTIDALNEELSVWIDESIDKLTQTRDAFEKNNTQETLESFFQAANDLKGQGEAVEFFLIVRMTSSLCELLGKADLCAHMPMRLIDAHIDAMKAATYSKISDNPDRIADLLAEELERKVTSFLDRHAAHAV